MSDNSPNPPTPHIAADVAVSVKAELSQESTGKLTDALIDTFSPVTQSLGLIGDYVRVYRAEVAERITRRAKTIAESRAVEMAAPPVKFLLPFYEKSSCESDEKIEELWAELLAAAGSRFDTRLMSYIDIVARMSPEEAVLLKELVNSHENWSYPFEQCVSIPNKKYISQTARSRLTYQQKQHSDFGGLTICAEQFAQEVNVSAGRLLWMTVQQIAVDGTKSGNSFHYPEPEKNRKTFQSLCVKGLVNICVETIVLEIGSVEVSWSEITPLGADFVRTLEGGEAMYS